MKKTTPSQDAACKRALAKYFESVGQGLAKIGDPEAPKWSATGAALRAQLKPRDVQS